MQHQVGQISHLRGRASASLLRRPDTLAGASLSKDGWKTCTKGTCNKLVFLHQKQCIPPWRMLTQQLPAQKRVT